MKQIRFMAHLLQETRIITDRSIPSADQVLTVEDHHSCLPAGG